MAFLAALAAAQREVNRAAICRMLGWLYPRLADEDCLARQVAEGQDILVGRSGTCDHHGHTT